MATMMMKTKTEGVINYILKAFGLPAGVRKKRRRRENSFITNKRRIQQILEQMRPLDLVEPPVPVPPVLPEQSARFFEELYRDLFNQLSWIIPEIQMLPGDQGRIVSEVCRLEDPGLDVS